MAKDRRDTKEREAPDRSSWGDLQGSLKDKLGCRALGHSGFQLHFSHYKVPMLFEK